MTAGRWIKPDSAVLGFDSPVTHCISRVLERVVTGINIHHPMQLNKFKFEDKTWCFFDRHVTEKFSIAVTHQNKTRLKYIICIKKPISALHGKYFINLWQLNIIGA